RVGATTHPDLDVLVVVVVSGGRRATAVAGRHPPASLERRAEWVVVGRAFAQRGLVDVAREVVDAERAHALRALAAGLTVVLEHLLALLHLKQVFVTVLVAHGFALEAVGVWAHLFALTREGPLLLSAQPLALCLADLAAGHEALVVERQLV